MSQQHTLPMGAIQPIKWHDNCVVVIDQTQLPQRYVEVNLRTVEQLAQAIKQLVVRGAPLLGIAAAYGIALAAHLLNEQETLAEAWQKLEDAAAILRRTRPTASNLSGALQQMLTPTDAPVSKLADLMLERAIEIHRADLDASARIAANVPQIMQQPGWVLTYCNTGALATGGGGTALGLIVEGSRRGLVQGVYACETRPLLQGARLTAWELSQLQIPYYVLCDNAAAALLSSGVINAVLVGADRIAVNGDTANKIGTRMLAQLSASSAVPFYVVAPRTTYDPATSTGATIEIEYRSDREVQAWAGLSVTPAETKAYNPAFDITPNELVTAYVTDYGVFKASELRSII